jgi:ATP-dependent helicase YprA (DUF1998 family)
MEGAEFTDILRKNPEATRQRFYFDTLRRTLGEALLLATSRVLGIDSTELGITFHAAKEAIAGRELIFFDTAPGGAGYSPRITDHVQEIFENAEHLLEGCRCGDSCYACLRTYYNQPFHKRLNRHLLLAGLRQFNAQNWRPAATAA